MMWTVLYYYGIRAPSIANRVRLDSHVALLSEDYNSFWPDQNLGLLFNPSSFPPPSAYILSTMSSKRGGQARVADDDSDLEDLLQHKGGETVESAPLNLDHLTKGQFDVPRRSGPGLTALASAHCRYLCYMYPRCCGTISVMAVAFAMFMFIGSLVNPTETFGVITNDWTTMKSQYDLKVGKIDHWCLKGDNDSCRCEDPLVPASRMEFKTWNDAFNENKKKVEAFRESNLLDVAFLGESLVEEMDGRWMGRQEGEELKSIRKVFQAQFKRDMSGIEGVALGIAGDTVSYAHDSSITFNQLPV